MLLIRRIPKILKIGPKNAKCFSFSKQNHPSDHLDLKVPPTDDYTDWIKPELPEYLQVRQRIRKETDNHMDDCAMMPFETRFKDFMQKEYTYRHDIEGKPDPDVERERKKWFGEDSLGDSKSFALRKKFAAPVLGMFDPEPPLKALRQLKILMPYIGLKDPDEFIYEMKNAAIMSTCRLKRTRNEYNLILQKKQNSLIKKFEEDALKLIEESESLKKRISSEETQIEDPFVQETLQKWYVLSLEFGDKKVGEGIVIESELQMGPGKNQPMPTKQVFLESGYAFREQVDDRPDDFNVKNRSIDWFKLEKVRQDVLDYAKPCFTREEAFKLLGDDFVIGLIDSMRSALSSAHDKLKLVLESEEHENANDAVNSNFIMESVEKAKASHTDLITRNRIFDHAIKLRYWMRDDLATKKQRLTRNLYDQTRDEMFRERQNHLNLLPARKKQYPYLAELDLKVTTMSTNIQNIHKDSYDCKQYERTVAIRVNLDSFAPKVQEALRELFPTKIDKKRKELVVVSKTFAGQNCNRRNAMEMLSKMIHEANLLNETGFPRNVEEYERSLLEKGKGQWEPFQCVTDKGKFERSRREIAGEAEKRRELFLRRAKEAISNYE